MASGLCTNEGEFRNTAGLDTVFRDFLWFYMTTLYLSNSDTIYTYLGTKTTMTF